MRPPTVEPEELANAKEKISELLADMLPGAKLVSVRSGRDSADDEALFVKILLQSSPRAQDIPQQSALRRKFQDWLIAEYGEERFPYFDFLTQADLEELNRKDD